MMKEKRVEAKHGIVCRLPGERFGYFGWPTVARMTDGALHRYRRAQERRVT